MGHFNLSQDLSLGPCLLLSSDILFLTLLVLHVIHTVVLPAFEVLTQGFEFNSLSLVAILEESLGFFLR